MTCSLSPWPWLLRLKLSAGVSSTRAGAVGRMAPAYSGLGGAAMGGIWYYWVYLS